MAFPSIIPALLLFFAFATVQADLYEQHTPATVFTVPMQPVRKELQVDADEPRVHPHIHPMVYPAISSGQSKYGTPKLNLLGNTVEYFAVVLIGTPGQPFSLQVDTGSAITAIPSLECPDCYHYNPSYNASASSSAKTLMCTDPECTNRACNNDGTCSFSVTYGDNSGISGRLMSDVLSLPTVYSSYTGSPGSGRSTINSLQSTAFDNTPITFGSITKQTSVFQQAGADGILGLAFGGSKLSCVPNCASLIMDVLVQQFNLADVFSIALRPINNNSIYNNPGGSLTIGGIDAATLGGANVFYTPVVAKPYYSVAIGDIQINEQSVGCTVSDFGQAVVDSGTSYMIIPDKPFQNMQKLMEGDCSLPYVCGDRTIFDHGHCVESSVVDVNVYPTLTIFLDQVKLDLPPSQYMIETLVSGKSYYCFGILNGGTTTRTILGDTFMHGYYVIFDRGNQRVGFANSALVSAGPRVLSPSNAFPIAIVAGAAAGGAAVILAIVAIIVVIRIRRNHRMRNESNAAQIETTVS